MQQIDYGSNERKTSEKMWRSFPWLWAIEQHWSYSNGGRVRVSVSRSSEKFTKFLATTPQTRQEAYVYHGCHDHTQCNLAYDWISQFRPYEGDATWAVPIRRLLLADGTVMKAIVIVQPFEGYKVITIFLPPKNTTLEILADHPSIHPEKL